MNLRQIRALYMLFYVFAVILCCLVINPNLLTNNDISSCECFLFAIVIMQYLYILSVQTSKLSIYTLSRRGVAFSAKSGR